MSQGQWIYVSEPLFAEQDAAAAIDGIVRASRARNSSLQVTGALLFCGSRFAQMLEGPMASLVELQHSIRADLRHGQVIDVVNRSAGQRIFADWSLAYSGPARYLAATLEQVSLKTSIDPGIVDKISCLFVEFAQT